MSFSIQTAPKWWLMNSFTREADSERQRRRGSKQDAGPRGSERSCPPLLGTTGADCFEHDCDVSVSSPRGSLARPQLDLTGAPGGAGRPHPHPVLHCNVGSRLSSTSFQTVSSPNGPRVKRKSPVPCECVKQAPDISSPRP